MHGSKLLPVASLVLVLMASFVGFRSCQPDPETEAGQNSVPQAPAPDADSPADTIRTLTAEVAEIKSQNDVLKRQNQNLLKQRSDIENRVAGTVRQELAEKDSAFNQLTKQLEGLKIRVEDIRLQQPVQTDIDIPLGLGIGSDDGISGDQPVRMITWIEPLNKGLGENRKDAGGGGSLLHAASEPASSKPTSDSQLAAQTGQTAQSKLQPAYTVPRNATLVGSTGMTALIGRIPFEGKVEDPFPFKVLVGRDNLAANGLEIPGVYGMVFSGETFGDWALACVRGKIQSVTYLFDDGTIRTLSSDDNSLTRLAGQQQGGNTRQNEPLGWISDRRGIPCVSGERISNAGSFLAGRILARAAEAAANGFGLGQTTRQVSPLTGVNTTTVTGDAAKFAGYNALSGAANEISNYIKERAAQSFDVVYVDTGAEIAVHVDRELPIDYNPSGRRLTYAQSNATPLDPHLD